MAADFIGVKLIIFARVDDRLIHGQVVQGWLPDTGAGAVVVVLETENPLISSLLRMSLPPEYPLSVLNVESTLIHCAQSKEKEFIIFNTLQDAQKFILLGGDIKELNIGGLHYAPGKEKLLTDIYINKTEKEIISNILSLGIKIDVRSMPKEISADVKGLL